MNSRERVKRAFHYEKPDRIPIFCMNLLKSDFLYGILFNPKLWQPNNYPPHVPGGINSISKLYYRLLVYNWKNEIRKRAKYKKKWWKDPHISIDEWGILWKSAGTESKDITKGHPFLGPLQKNWDNLDSFELPNGSNPDRFRLIRNRLWKFLAKDKYTVGEIGANGFFNLCSQIRGFNNVLIDFRRSPKNLTQLIEKIESYYLTQINEFKKQYPKLDSIFIADDLGTQKSPFISPDVFNTFFKEPYKKIVKLTIDLGMDFILHSCGQIFELMPDIMETGINIFQFDSPLMTGVENFKMFAESKRAAFWLSSNIQSTYVLGTPIEVENEIKCYIEHIGKQEGGLAIHEYDAYKTLDTPKENVIAQRRATQKWGKYNEDGIINWLD
ncbi:MAG: uroporphyrinogen decarboxylase family protein [Candidatus Hodarchaeota archaeon]